MNSAHSRGVRSFVASQRLNNMPQSTRVVLHLDYTVAVGRGDSRCLRSLSSNCDLENGLSR